VAINEAVELAKSFGGTDGHKYVNGVLDKTAPRCAASRSRRRAADAAEARESGQKPDVGHVEW
jgi:N utilization substance protein B